jgi:hypothetical protein
VSHIGREKFVSHIGREKADMLPYFSHISVHACPESRGLTIF